MSDPTHAPQPADEARSEALSWLAGQFRWESLLHDLHELTEQQGAPVVELECPPRRDTRTSNRDENAA